VRPKDTATPREDAVSLLSEYACIFGPFIDMLRKYLDVFTMRETSSTPQRLMGK